MNSPLIRPLFLGGETLREKTAPKHNLPRIMARKAALACIFPGTSSSYQSALIALFEWINMFVWFVGRLSIVFTSDIVLLSLTDLPCKSPCFILCNSGF